SADAARVSEGVAASRRSRLGRSAAALALPAVEIAPNAPLDPSTWHLAEIGACSAAMGWSASLASLEPPLVAIVDAGFEFRDPRLEQAWKRDASGEVLVVDLVEARETDARRGGFGTIAGHGHAVASLIAARRLETSPEVQGVLPKATLLPIVVAAAEPGPRWRTPRGHASTVLLALNAAADLGAKVVNVSLGVPVDRSELERLASDPVWDRLERDGVIVVCAAGNDGRDLDLEPVFPASIDRPNVIAVAAHGRDGILLGHDAPAGESSGPRSGFGVGRVECSAPGEALVVATTRGRSELVEGTSYAAALVSAALAAAMAIEPDAKSERLLERVTASPRSDTLEGLVARGAVRLPSD
ncbi:MAG: S8 family serine peptidase, partial [Phycisphaerales bacterium]